VVAVVRETSVGSSEEVTRDRLLGLDNYETITQNLFHSGQVAPIRNWVHGSVLDVGAGHGRFSIGNPSTFSLDIERRSLRRGLDLGNISRGIVGTALRLPFKNESFDTVLALGIVEHIHPASIATLFDELTRVVRPGGRLVVRVSSPYAPFALLRVQTWNNSLHPFSPFRLRAALVRRGWQPIAWISSGLLGVTHILPMTVNAPIPWARSVSLVFRRCESE